METRLKEEIEVEFIAESMKCCVLCPEVKESLKLLVNHFKDGNCEDHSQSSPSLNIKSSSLTTLCSCPIGIQLQLDLISHLLPQLPSEDPPSIEDIQVENEIYIEDPQIEKHELITSDEDVSSQNKLQFPCELCSKVLHTKNGLRKHFNMMHAPENTFQCPRCDDGRCNTLKNLHAHMRTHEDVKLESKVCEKCNKTFRSEKQFYHHRLLHREKLLECDHCGMRFNMKQPLQKHIFTHFDIRVPREAESKALCEICSKLVSSSRMKRHLGTHYNEYRPANYKCDFEGCSKAFTEFRNLEDHQNTHKNLKPYFCEFCNNTFRHRAALRQHRLRHIEPEKHKCHVCQECFVTNQSLKKHMIRQHRDGDIDVRPYACDQCTSTFKYEDFLLRHVKDVHNPKPQIQQKCDHCSYIAHNMKNYFQHMRRTHNIKKRLNNRVFPTSAIS